MRTPHPMTTIQRNAAAAALSAFAGMAAAIHAQTINPEVEPNDNKADAVVNGVIVLDVGDGVAGVSTSLSEPDYFLIRTSAAAPGIYRHRLVLTTTGTEGHIARIQGLSQTGGWIDPNSDVIAQSASTLTNPPRTVEWYGFGREEQIFYRVHGAATTSEPYRAVLETTPIAPIDLGTFEAGTIEITTFNQGHTTNTSLWIYDSGLNAIPEFGNSNEPSPGTSFSSRLTREFAPGVYYMALTANNLALNLARAPDDRNQSAIAMDFADAAASSNGSEADVSFAVVDQYGPVEYGAVRDRFEVLWYRFTVGTVDPGACCLPSGACALATAASCDVQEGIFRGTGTACDPAANCPQPPTGACCLLDNSCVNVWRGDCHDQGGTYAGDGSACSGITCPSTLQATFPTTFLSGGTAGVFFDLTSAAGITVPRIDYYAYASEGTTVSVELWTREGTYIGHDNDPTGWVLHDTVQGTSGALVAAAALHLNTPLSVPAGQTVGVYLLTTFGGLRYAQTTQAVYENDDVTLFTERVRTGRWSGTLYTDRAFSGTIFYTLGAVFPCYANCDESTIAPVLNVDDFTCFINAFAAGSSLPHEQQVSHYANCDGSSLAPALNVDDFTCFINAFAQGCP